MKTEWIQKEEDHDLMIGDCNFGQVFKGMEDTYICQTILHGIIGVETSLERAKKAVEEQARQTVKDFSWV